MTARCSLTGSGAAAEAEAGQRPRVPLSRQQMMKLDLRCKCGLRVQMVYRRRGCLALAGAIQGGLDPPLPPSNCAKYSK
jgi:hypothetical protein